MDKRTNTELEIRVKANNGFALDLYSNLKKERGNIFFSPTSISMAMTMVYEGARGKTAEEIGKVFHYPQNDSDRRAYFADMMRRLNKEDVEYKISLANALWVQKDCELLKEYIESVEKNYGAKATNLDFLHDAENSCKTINGWVEEKTKGKIMDVCPVGSINPDTRLVLTNAIYFKGDWKAQFAKEATKEENFWLDSKKTVKVPMMSHFETIDFKYGETEDLQLLEMPYKGGDLSMVVILPKENDLAPIEDSLTMENLEEWRAGMEREMVAVYMPKFKMETSYEMSNALSEMGMPTAFTDNADLSGINGEGELWISQVLHKAFVDVNEEGTEAAAVTAIFLNATGPAPISKPKVFRADHPFIFLIQERDNGNILFMGRVEDPGPYS